MHCYAALHRSLCAADGLDLAEFGLGAVFPAVREFAFETKRHTPASAGANEEGRERRAKQRARTQLQTTAQIFTKNLMCAMYALMSSHVLTPIRFAAKQQAECRDGRYQRNCSQARYGVCVLPAISVTNGKRLPSTPDLRTTTRNIA